GLRSAILGLSLLFLASHDTTPTELYSLSLHDALPISAYPAKTTRATVPRPVRMATRTVHGMVIRRTAPSWPFMPAMLVPSTMLRSEEHTSELQSRENLVCRLLLEKKKKDELVHCATMR